MSRDTTPSWPFQHARVRGVSSLLPEGMLICAPESSSSLVASWCPSLEKEKGETREGGREGED